MRTFALYGAKNFGYFEIYGVSARTRGAEPVRIFGGQVGQFMRFCTDVIYGQPLTVMQPFTPDELCGQVSSNQVFFFTSQEKYS